VEGNTEARLAALETRLKELQDKEEIHEALMRYCRGLDRADSEAIEQTFHPEGVADHGIMFFTADGIGETLAKMSREQMVMHFVGNELIEVEGDEAYSEAYFISFTEIDRDGQAYMLWRGARYIDRWERRETGWKIAYRVVAGSWDRIDPVLERHPYTEKYYHAEPYPNDRVYTIRSEGQRTGKQASQEEKARETELREAYERSLSSAGFSTASGSESPS
jgi:hypothetical protein